MGFGFHRPSTITEALELAAELGDPRFIAGGTDLLVQIRNGRPIPRSVISLRGLGELSGITAGDRLRVGATAPLTDVAAHPEVRALFPALVESIEVLGSPQIRNVATLGGNLCNASPAADTAPPLLVYGAIVEITGAGGVREVPISELFRGPGETCVAAGEIVSAILLEYPDPTAKSVFVRKGRVRMDLAIVSVAALASVEDGVLRGVRLAAGAVAPTPLRLERAESVLEGSTADPETRAGAVETARSEISPITDLRSTAAYRRHLTGVLLDRATSRIIGVTR